jgi:hypothetical protein
MTNIYGTEVTRRQYNIGLHSPCYRSANFQYSLLVFGLNLSKSVLNKNFTWMQVYSVLQKRNSISYKNRL